MICGCYWERTKEFGDVLRQCSAHRRSVIDYGQSSEPMNKAEVDILRVKLENNGFQTVTSEEL